MVTTDIAITVTRTNIGGTNGSGTIIYTVNGSKSVTRSILYNPWITRHLHHHKFTGNKKVTRRNKI